MDHYLGIIIQQCLRDPSVVKDLHITAVKQPMSWVFLLASVPEGQFEQHVRILQENMVCDDTWYAHYFRGDQLVVVFRERVFHISTNRDSWAPAIEYGLAHGIPSEQLDFIPHTEAGMRERFGVT